jgi:hypothetical protein
VKPSHLNNRLISTLGFSNSVDGFTINDSDVIALSSGNPWHVKNGSLNSHARTFKGTTSDEYILYSTLSRLGILFGSLVSYETTVTLLFFRTQISSAISLRTMIL